MSDAIAEARRALSEDRPREASWPLLQRWRETHDPGIAHVLDRLLLVQADRGEIPVPAPRSYDAPAWHVLWMHPYVDADPPDPRATLPLLAAHFGGRNRSWDERAAAWLVAHGDPRVAGWLDIACGDTFVEERARLVAQLPTPAPLPELERRALATLAAEVESRVPEPLRPPVFSRRPRLEETVQALLFTTRFGPLLPFVTGPRFEHGELRGVHLLARAYALRQLRGAPALRAVREVTFFGDDHWAAPRRPPWVQGSWDGVEARAEAVALLQSPELAVESVGPLPLTVAEALAGTEAGWRELTLITQADLEMAAGWASAFARLPTASLQAVHLLTDDAGLMRELLHLLPPGVTKVTARGPIATLDTWLGLLRGTVLRYEQASGQGWKLTLDRQDGGWALEASLPWHWDRYESAWEDPPTPGQELADWLRDAPPDLLVALTVKSHGELQDYEPILASARRQERLRRVAVEDDEGRMVEV